MLPFRDNRPPNGRKGQNCREKSLQLADLLPIFTSKSGDGPRIWRGFFDHE